MLLALCVVAAGVVAAGVGVPKGFATVAVEFAGAGAGVAAATVLAAGFAAVVAAEGVEAVVVAEPSGFETVATAGAVVVAEGACVEAGGVTVPESTLVVTFAAPVELVDGAGVAGCVAAALSNAFATAVEVGALGADAETVPCAVSVEGADFVTIVAAAVFCAGAAGIDDVAGVALNGALWPCA